ncbi:hypothetical protein C8T65DRAFT_700339 [Cerioporus squamosus]|nr:hypothetical protein C8T65DRAFT_700339 [Cerioporus squamosus]
MTCNPSVKAVKLEEVTARYGATYFRDALSRFVAQRNHPEYTPAQLERAAASVYIPFYKIPVFHKVKFWLEDPHDFALPGSELRDVIHCRPSRKSKHGNDIPGRFDTALVRDPARDAADIHRRCVAQVRLVFKIPDKSMAELFPHIPPVQRLNHLAYVEWFTPFEHASDNHGLYKVKRSLRGRARLASIITIEQLERSCHLFPEFGPVAPRDWTADNVLDKCPAFFVNTFSDRHMYKLLY